MDPIFTQADMDKVLADHQKELDSFKTTFEKTHVSLDIHRTLEKENKQFKLETKTKSIKDEFLKNDGNEDFFEDFFNINSKGLLEVDEKELTNSIRAIQKTKPWAFNSSLKQEEKHDHLYNENKVLKELAGMNNDELVADTMYRKNSIKFN